MLLGSPPTPWRAEPQQVLSPMSARPHDHLKLATGVKCLAKITRGPAGFCQMLIAGYTRRIFMLILIVHGCSGVRGRAKLAQSFTCVGHRFSKSRCGDLAGALCRERGLGESRGTSWWEVEIDLTAEVEQKQRRDGAEEHSAASCA